MLGWALVLGNFQCQGILLIWKIVYQGFSVLAVGGLGYCLDFFSRRFYRVSVSLFPGDDSI